MERRITCPACGSENVYRRGTSEYLCGQCHHEFAVAPRPSTSKQAQRPLRIFLSYGHVDGEVVRPVREYLEARGHDVFYDKSDIKAGDDWRGRIAEAIKRSDVVIAFLSRHAYREGGVCREEVDIALRVRGGNVQTVLLDPQDEVEPPAVLTRRQWIDLSAWQELREKDRGAFRLWFDMRMRDLADGIESPGSASFPGDMAWLAERLGVLPDNGRQAQLLSKPFFGREWLTASVRE